MSDSLFKILGICIIGAVAVQTVKGRSLEQGLLLSMGAGAVAVVFLIKTVAEPINLIGERLEAAGTDPEFFKIALKSVGLGYISSFVADACRECGQTLLASTAETAGKCAILYLAMPLIISISETAVGFIT